MTGLKTLLVLPVLWLLMTTLAAPARAAENHSLLVAPDNALGFWLVGPAGPVLEGSPAAWGPNWGWVGAPEARPVTRAGELSFSTDLKLGGGTIRIAGIAKAASPQSVKYTYTLSSKTDVPLTMFTIQLVVPEAMRHGDVEIKLKDGQTKTLNMPLHLGESFKEVEQLTFKLTGADKIAETATATFDPPIDIQPENNTLRLLLAHEVFKAGQSVLNLTFATTDDLKFAATAEEQAAYVKTLPGTDWFAYKPTAAALDAPAVIGIEDWLDKPAGKHGGVRIVGDHFALEDGTPIKFWGVNLSYGAMCCPTKEDANDTAKRFARFGVNGVRLHKFTGPGWEGIGDDRDGTKLKPDGLDRLDYFTNQLASQGVYFGFSHTYGYHIRPGNSDRYLAYDEIEKGLGGNTYALMNFAEDCQDLMIDMVVGLLKHKNAYTGKTYAEDPALSYIELQNEDDIFFYTTSNVLNKCPTYRKNLEQRFAKWLLAKYKTQEALATAWGDSLKSGETVSGAVKVQDNPWFMGSDNLPKLQDGPRQRMLDSAAFFHDVQNAFYSRFVKAIRDAGYKGPICGSPWQAPSGLPNYYNLKSDALVGWVDRHNYFGGGFNDTMLSQPGSGYLSSGLQQVANRPFGVSEWIHVYPSLYSAEGPAIMAAYALGLQGWDSSYEFQSSSNHAPMANIVGTFPWGVWEADVPSQMGQFPTLARMIMRGDVKEAPIISTRHVTSKNLQDGQFDFSDSVQQSGDIKTFGGTVPAEALAAGRLVVSFDDKPAPSTFPDMSKYQTGKVITSVTGQLRWDFSGKGFFTIDTPGTKGLVGFAPAAAQTMGNVTINLRSPYASIVLTAREKQSNLANCKSALISAVARNSNTGFRYLDLNGKVLENGKGPVMLEPVLADVTIAGRGIASVQVLDHDGVATGKTLPVTNGAFTIDGTKDKTLYYEVVFK
jgi:hypothetical protein